MAAWLLACLLAGWMGNWLVMAITPPLHTHPPSCNGLFDTPTPLLSTNGTGLGGKTVVVVVVGWMANAQKIASLSQL